MQKESNMKLAQNVQQFLDRPMDRKEFFKHVGVGGLLVMGGGAVVKSAQQLWAPEAHAQPVAKSKQPVEEQNKSTGSAYGSGTYGG